MGGSFSASFLSSSTSFRSVQINIDGGFVEKHIVTRRYQHFIWNNSLSFHSSALVAGRTRHAHSFIWHKAEVGWIDASKYKDNRGIEIKWELFAIGINILSPSIYIYPWSVAFCWDYHFWVVALGRFYSFYFLFTLLWLKHKNMLHTSLKLGAIVFTLTYASV
jgi:hypothetical protein